MALFNIMKDSGKPYASPKPASAQLVRPSGINRGRAQKRVERRRRRRGALSAKSRDRRHHAGLVNASAPRPKAATTGNETGPTTIINTAPGATAGASASLRPKDASALVIAASRATGIVTRDSTSGAARIPKIPHSLRAKAGGLSASPASARKRKPPTLWRCRSWFWALGRALRSASAGRGMRP